jgi:hypothetical protein
MISRDEAFACLKNFVLFFAIGFACACAIGSWLEQIEIANAFNRITQ